MGRLGLRRQSEGRRYTDLRVKLPPDQTKLTFLAKGQPLDLPTNPASMEAGLRQSRHIYSKLSHLTFKTCMLDGARASAVHKRPSVDRIRCRITPFTFYGYHSIATEYDSSRAESRCSLQVLTTPIQYACRVYAQAEGVPNLTPAHHPVDMDTILALIVPSVYI